MAPALRLPYTGSFTPASPHAGKLPLAEARVILRQLLMALAHCHGQGVTHRNLKPKYVLLQPQQPDTAPAAPAAPAGADAADAADARDAPRWRWPRGWEGAPPGAEEEGGGGWWVKLSDFNSVRWLGAAMAAEDDPIYGAAQVTGDDGPAPPWHASGFPLTCMHACIGMRSGGDRMHLSRTHLRTDIGPASAVCTHRRSEPLEPKA